MDIYFKISKEEYLNSIRDFLRLKQRSLTNLLIFLFMTVGQIGLVIWNIVSLRITGSSRMILISISALICLTQVFYQCSIDLRARTQLRRSVEKGRISEDFWGQQHLSLKDDVVRLRCGKTQLKYDCAYFSDVQHIGNMLAINFRRGKDVHQLLVPVTAFSDSAQRACFESALLEAKRASILSGYANTAHPRPSSPLYSVDFDCTASEFAHDYVWAARFVYFTAVPYDMTMLAKLAAAAFLLYHIAAANITGAAFIAFTVCIIMILLYPVIFAFTPLIRQVAKRNTASLFGGLTSIRCSVDVTEDSLVYSGDTFYNQIPLSSVYGAEKHKTFAAIYLKDHTSVVVHLTPENSDEVTRMILHLEAVGGSNRKARFRRIRPSAN